MTLRQRLCLTLPSDLLARLNDLADRRKLSRSAVAEAAIASFLSPDALDTREAAFTRRLDRLSRQTARLERDVRLTADTLALFVAIRLQQGSSFLSEIPDDIDLGREDADD
jgi:hypothetical protein